MTKSAGNCFCAVNFASAFITEAHWESSQCTIFYKQHLYKQRQAESGKKISKTLSNIRDWTVDEYFQTTSLFQWDYMINCNEMKMIMEKYIP